MDVSDQLTEELERFYNVRKKRGFKAGQGRNGSKVYPADFQRVLTKAGLRKQKLHIKRHTYASLLLIAGESPVYVKEQLGHSSIKITFDIYGHPILTSNRGAVNRLDEMGQSAPLRNRKAAAF